MIFDVLETLRQAAVDTATGLNAVLADVNAAKSQTLAGASLQPCPELATFYAWDAATPPADMTLPAILQIWETSPNLLPTQQNKWMGDHKITWVYITEEIGGGQARADMAIMAHAIRKVVDAVEGSGTIQQVKDRMFSTSGWAMAGRRFGGMLYAFTIVERDENP